MSSPVESPCSAMKRSNIHLRDNTNQNSFTNLATLNIDKDISVDNAINMVAGNHKNNETLNIVDLCVTKIIVLNRIQVQGSIKSFIRTDVS